MIMAMGGVAGLQVGAKMPFLAPFRSSGLPDPGPGVVFSTQELTTAAALTPPEPGMFLVNIRVTGGITPGDFAFIYTNPDTAHFPAPASGADATGAIGLPNVIDYPVNYPLRGTNISSGLVALNGGILRVELTYCNQPGPGPAMSLYRGVSVYAAVSDTNGHAETFTFDAAPSRFRYFVAMISQQTGSLTGIPRATLTLPVNGAYSQSIACEGASAGNMPTWVPALDMRTANSFSITFQAQSLGGATDVEIGGVGFY